VLPGLDPVPAPVAVAAAGLLVIAAGWTTHNVWRTGRALLAAQRLCRHLASDPAGSPVVVVDDAHPDAFTTPNLRARIVVTTGMLAALDPPGRQVLLAHEQSHRVHRHTWWVLAAELAAAVNPLLHPTAAAVRNATERWADEDAARVTNRRLVAATIAQVALLGARSSPATAAAATGGQVPRRVAALLHAPPRIRAWRLLALITVTVAVLLGALAVERTGESLFEHAKRPAATVTVRSAPIR
jgi:hypothetical protein